MTKKKRVYKNDHMKEFNKRLLAVSHRHSIYNVFSDFMTMAVCAYHPTNILTLCTQKDEENEKLYMETIKRYDKGDIKMLTEMLGILVDKAYWHEYSDLLGDVFMEHFGARAKKGQFFTPIEVCDLMAMMTVNPKTEGEVMNDCAVGSGRNLMRAAKVAPNNFFSGNDVDPVCAKMCALNFYLNGMSGEVGWGNSLSLEFWGAWEVNLNKPGILPVKPEDTYTFSFALPKANEKADEQLSIAIDNYNEKQEKKKKKKKKASPKKPKKEGGEQLGLF